MNKRIEFTRKVKSQVITRANGKCEKCSAMLKTGEGEVDHILPCAFGGETTVANGRLLCRVCHVEKTADDIRRVRKSDRQRDKASGAVRSKSAQATRLISKAQAANYCGAGPSAFAHWVKQGTLPKPVPGTNRWDIKAIDYRLDKLAGIPLTAKAPELEFDKMEAKIDARITQRRSQGKKRLAGGSVRVYFYAWRGGPLLKDMEGCPLQPHEPEFHAAYAEACKAQAKVPNGTLSYLIKEHSRSSDFTSKSDKTKRAYVRFLTEIEDIFGDLSLEYIQSQRARGKFKQWRDTLADRPRTADYEPVDNNPVVHVTNKPHVC